ncbi:hypothetical protein F4778DRAFT_706463 [Xylariomycetidae sp. FL2044]|nr:hypothetical protein F4778DRAFT_706463 [Xylariomycetidae sp. FL2044]
MFGLPDDVPAPMTPEHAVSVSMVIKHVAQAWHHGKKVPLPIDEAMQTHERACKLQPQTISGKPPPHALHELVSIANDETRLLRRQLEHDIEELEDVLYTENIRLEKLDHKLQGMKNQLARLSKYESKEPTRQAHRSDGRDSGRRSDPRVSSRRELSPPRSETHVGDKKGGALPVFSPHAHQLPRRPNTNRAGAKHDDTRAAD